MNDTRAVSLCDRCYDPLTRYEGGLSLTVLVGIHPVTPPVLLCKSCADLCKGELKAWALRAFGTPEVRAKMYDKLDDTMRELVKARRKPIGDFGGQ